MNGSVTHSTAEKLPRFVNREELQQILNNLSSKNNILEDSQWHFEGVDNFTLDITPLNVLYKTHADWCQRLGIDPAWLAKILFLYSTKGVRTPGLFRVNFNSISKTLFYLAKRNKLLIDKNHLKDYFNYLLMHSMEKGQPIKRLTPLNYSSFSKGLRIIDWVQALKRLNRQGIFFAEAFSEQVITRALKATIDTLSSGDLTYRDWQEGRSFNHLTLDYGRYYVEHCAEFFKRHITLAIAMRCTLAHVSDIAINAGLSHNENSLRTLTTPIVGSFLVGKSINQLPSDYRKNLQDKWLNNLQQATLATFKEYLIPLRVREALLSDGEVKKLVAHLELGTLTTEKIEWFKSVITVIINRIDPHINLSKHTLELEEQWLVDTVAPEIDLEALDTITNATWQRLQTELDLSLPKCEDFQSMGLTLANSRKSTYVYEFIARTEDAGVINFVALTGWRASEYGFGLNDIRISRNRDLLDQKDCPFRYEVKWLVPKTNGQTMLHREITRSAYDYVRQLARLVQAGDKSPCLYSFTESAKHPNHSKAHIESAVRGMWLHYVHHYQPFNQLDSFDDLNMLRTKMNATSLSMAENIRLQELLQRNNEENWEQLNDDPLLREARRRARTELSRIQFFFKDKERNSTVWAYREGTLSREHQILFDCYLSAETKSSIKALDSEKQVTVSYKKSVMNEIWSDTLYPTPHAFRHMWAEAVYRRFSGDSGWMIRSTFKHISQNMWLAYIRNKDNRRQHDRVKRRVVSSLLSNYLHKSGRGFAGATDKLLRRLFLRTKIVDMERMGTAIEEFGLQEISDIKATPWGYCLLRHRNQHRAKCAEDGVPQRHNASVAICLGCINYLAQDGNIEGILLNIANDLKVLHNPRVPESFRRVSYDTVRNALNNLKKLDVEDEILYELKTALTMGCLRRAS